MKVQRGKIHFYLDMTLDFSKPGEVKVSMVPYVKEMLEYFQIHDDSNATMATLQEIICSK